MCMLKWNWIDWKFYGSAMLRYVNDIPEFCWWRFYQATLQQKSNNFFRLVKSAQKIGFATIATLCLMLKIAKIGTATATENYDAIFCRFEVEMYKQWTASVDEKSQYNLTQPLLTRNKETMLLTVNFNPQVRSSRLWFFEPNRVCDDILWQCLRWSMSFSWPIHILTGSASFGWFHGVYWLKMASADVWNIILYKQQEAKGRF